MLDFRIRTFLKVCETMNYRMAAEQLNMSQPSITQHIHSLEEHYSCKLFIYDKKKLHKTKEAEILEHYSISMRANERQIEKLILSQPKKEIRIGATKTIGNYVINNDIYSILESDDVSLSFIIDNTKNLLELLNKNKLDLLIIEGLFDKSKYDHKLYKMEDFVGICAEDNEFAGKTVKFDDLFKQNLIIREEGSGTRAILEEELSKNSYSIEQFNNINCISSFSYIKNIVRANKGISFAFKAIADSDEEIATFEIESGNILREFNFVYLHSTEVDSIISNFI